MTDHVKYELICMDNPITPDDDLDSYPLATLETGHLAHAHQVAIVLLAHRRSEGSRFSRDDPGNQALQQVHVASGNEGMRDVE